MLTAKLLHTLTHPNSAYGAAFSTDGSLLATASLDNSIKLWNVATGEEKARLKWHGDGV
jgi:WD40 repeat protein